MVDSREDDTLVNPKGRLQKPPASAPDPATISDTFPLMMADRFEIMRPLGVGGMGKVYLVRDRHIEGREVALKVLRKRYSGDPEFKKLFFREIKSAQQFVSAHVNQVRDTGQLPDGSLFLTMDFVDGESLHAKLTREHVLLPRHALEIARQILLGLASGHDKGIVHRDVKPQNVMLQRRVAKTDDNPHGVDVRVLDFGIAGATAELATEGASGTPAYMSPEQAKGQAVDARSDLFAVGLVLFEMIAGERLFKGRTLREIETSVLEERIENRVAELTGVQAPIKKILARALQKDRDKRFQSCAEFVTAIERSKAYKLPTNVPIWAWCVMGGLALVAVTRGTILAGDQRAELQDERARNQQAKDEVARLTLELQNQNNAANDKLRDSDDAKNTAVQVQLKAIADLETGKREWATKEGDYELRVARLDNQVQLLTQTKEAQVQRLTAKDEQLAEARSSIARLEDDVKGLRAQIVKLQPEYRRAQALEKILAFQRLDQFSEARKTFQELKGSAFSSEGLEGADFVEALVIAGDALETFREGGSADVRAYFEAKPAAQRAIQLRDGFPTLAAGWIGLEELTPGERLRSVDRSLADLAQQLDAASGTAEAVHEARWTEIQARGPLQDPEAALAHWELFRCQHLTVLAGLALAEIQERSVVDGVLARKNLVGLDVLPKWVTVIEASDDLLAELRPRFDLFDYARRFYDATEGNEDRFDLTFDLLPAGSAADGWAGKLALASQLLSDESAYPFRDGDVLVYRNSNDGNVTFWEERYSASKADTRPSDWTFQRAIYRGDGSVVQPLRNFSMSRRGKAWSFGTDPTPVLDLAAEELSFDVVQAAARPESDFPAQLALSEFERESFASTWEGSDRTCLVWRRNDTEVWISPRWGLVKHVSRTERGTVERDLVFSNRTRP